MAMGIIVIFVYLKTQNHRLDIEMYDLIVTVACNIALEHRKQEGLCKG